MSEEDEEDSITLFAKYLRQLKEAQWQNSIDGLPEGKTLPHHNMLLLWKLDEGFTDTFFNVPKRATPPRTTTTSLAKADTSSASKRNTRSATKADSAAANLRNKFDT